MRLKPWRRGQGSRWGKAKVLEAWPRRPLDCGQGPGGTGKAAVGMQPRPWRRCQGSLGGAANALGSRPWGPWRCSQGPGGAAKAAVVNVQGTGVAAKAAVGTQPRPWG